MMRGNAKEGIAFIIINSGYMRISEKMFIIKFLLFYVSIMLAMCLDNICWIPDSPEWKSIKINFYVFVFLNREFGIPKNKAGFSYCWKNRILEVLKHPRDIIPAIISSLVLSLIWGNI